MDSILTSIKKLLGITEEYESFDVDIIIYINAALMILNQLGVGPPRGFIIEDKNSTWIDFIGDRLDLATIKSYVYLKTRLIFDPPQTGPLVEAISKQITELEWRINVQVENGPPAFIEPDVLDYNDLVNKPQIETTTLVGNKKLKDVGIEDVSNASIQTLFK